MGKYGADGRCGAYGRHGAHGVVGQLCDVDCDVAAVAFGPSVLPQITGYFSNFVHFFF
jgi:hypothetical protein